MILSRLGDTKLADRGGVNPYKHVCIFVKKVFFLYFPSIRVNIFQDDTR